jgi:hypothetical protein
MNTLFVCAHRHAWLACCPEMCFVLYFGLWNVLAHVVGAYCAINICDKVSILCTSGFGGQMVSMLASGTQDRGFKPGQSHRIFSGVKKS